METLANSFNCAAHPRVKTREKKAETVLSDFVNCMGARAQGGQISENSFMEYYADINACLPAEKDDYFIDLVLKTWNINTGAVHVSAQRIEELENIIFEKVR